MTTSLNWLKEYVDIDLPAAGVEQLLTSLGLEVEGMEEREAVPGGLAGVVVGQVLECWKHPGADKLSLTKVNIGTDETLQIVCGAPNVAAGQKVLVATIGAKLHPVTGEPFTIKKGKIRGEDSEGMICAEDEIGLGNSHAGILVLPPATPVGMAARDYFKLENDVIFEIGLTPNRSDATCHLGVAKDLAAALKVRHGGSGEVRLPKIDLPSFGNLEGLPAFPVTVENTEACPRFTGVVIKNLQIGESPDWLKNRLLAVGVRPISNVVDITNFILHELGQPLHAYDLEKIDGQKIMVKTLPQGTKYLTLDGRERSLSSEDLMVCDGDSKGMCIGGVFGGLDSGVSGGTTAIFLESAHFSPRWIRRSSTRHDLRTDAARVFEKGSDPNNCVFALQRAAALLVEIAGGEIASGIVDIYPDPIAPAQIEVKYGYVNGLIGTAISPEKIREILSALQMEITAETTDGFTVAVPTNKADVTRPADVVEEILRVFGLNNVPVPTQMRSSMVQREYPDDNQVRNTISDYLAANGFNEAMSLSLSQSKFYEEILPTGKEGLVHVNNTSNVHLDVMRATMLFSGLEAVAHNQNRQQGDLKLFEFGKTYRFKTLDDRQKTLDGQRVDVRQLFEEEQHLALFLTGQRLGESWLNGAKRQSDFFTLKTFSENILARLGIGGYQQTVVQDEVFAYGMNFHRGPKSMVKFGKVQPRICKKMGIKTDVFFADFDWDALLKRAKKASISMVELNKYPTVRRDLALVIGNSVKFSDLAALAAKVGKKVLKGVNLFDVFEDEKRLGKDKVSYAMSFVFENTERTLNDKEVDQVMDELVRGFEEKFGALIRR